MGTFKTINPLSLVVRLFLVVFLLGSSSYLLINTIKLTFAKCFEKERKALINFKHGLKDPSGRLSSWVGDDCCRWSGVGCNNISGHVVKLHLKNPFSPGEEFQHIWTWRQGLYSLEYDEQMALKSQYQRWCLGGKMNSSLLHLKYLTYLDLSFNDFEGIQIPKFLGMLKNLRYLDLSYSLFAGGIPPHLGNLSSLNYLYLGSFRKPENVVSTVTDLHIPNLEWLSGLTSLKYLKMESIYVEDGTNWVQSINMLPNLVELHLPGCSLQHLPLSLPFVNLTLLSVFDIYSKDFNSSLPNWLFNLTSLTELDLGNNFFEGELPDSIGILSNLQYLFLDSNSLSGTIPQSLWQLSKLILLNLNGNSWEGVLMEAHLMNLTSLKHLEIRTGKLLYYFYIEDRVTPLVFNVTYKWVPPFSLKALVLENCLVGPRFPVWLQVQSELKDVVLKNVGIADTIPEQWFSTLSSNQVRRLDLSSNQINGKLPIHLEFPNLEFLDLSNNFFEGSLPLWSTNAFVLFLNNNSFSGPIPQNIGEMMPWLHYFYMFENRLNGTIPSSICTMKNLGYLILRTNQLSGGLPECWNESQSLIFMDLASNNLSGNIPSSLGSLNSLEVLMLSNNDLHGKIPPSLQKCNLMMIDLGGNKLSGKLPLWIGELATTLRMLRLRSNSFSGDIPRQWCNLENLNILDLAYNHLSGVIPHCLGSLLALVDGNSSSNFEDLLNMEQMMVVAKGQELKYQGRTIHYVKSIDLSANSLVGEIPKEITSLVAIRTLNFSMNNLSGCIPDDIGNLRWLETLDVSNNNLSGSIPQSLSLLTSLAYLNLSHNNLAGEIPTGYQLQTLDDPSIYEGNPLLCGLPLPTRCPDDDTSNPLTPNRSGVDDNDDENDLEMVWFYVSMGPGFVVGFWGGFWFHIGKEVVEACLLPILGEHDRKDSSYDLIESHSFAKKMGSVKN